jgi:hypothetical protein
MGRPSEWPILLRCPEHPVQNRRTPLISPITTGLGTHATLEWHAQNSKWPRWLRHCKPLHYGVKPPKQTLLDRESHAQYG